MAASLHVLCLQFYVINVGFIFSALISKIGNYYSFPDANVPYASAFQAASEATFAGVQGHIWVPESFFEMDQVGSLSIVHRKPIWFGITDEASEGAWVYTAGPGKGARANNILWWSPREPGGGTGENCAVYYPGQWWLADFSCTAHSFGYVIEFECPLGQRFNSQGTSCIGTVHASAFCLATCMICSSLQTIRLSATTPLRMEGGCRCASRHSMGLQAGTLPGTDSAVLMSMDTLARRVASTPYTISTYFDQKPRCCSALGRVCM